MNHLKQLSETRQKKRLPTFCAFIDLKKAFDFDDRNLLRRCLNETRISGKLLKALKSLYTSVLSCVSVNGLTTEWFNVKTGLRQGCALSPILFNLFVNDFAAAVKALGKGVEIDDGEKVCIMLYAADIVLLADNENDVQSMMNLLDNWCSVIYLVIKPIKSHIV